MKKRIMAFLLAVTMIINVNELSYLTVHAASTDSQSVATEDSATSETTTPSTTEGNDSSKVEDTSNTTNQNVAEASQTGEETNASQATVTDTTTTEENANTESSTKTESSTSSTDITEEKSLVPNETETTENAESITNENSLESKNMQDIPSDTTVVYSYDTLELGKAVTASVGVYERYYLFQPTESGWYDFSTEGEESSTVTVYTFHTDTQITEYLTSASNVNGVFCEMTAGNSYLFRFYKSGSDSSQITLNKMSPITGISVTAPTTDSVLGYDYGLNLQGMTLTVKHEDGSENIVTNKEKRFEQYKGQFIHVTFNGSDFRNVYTTMTMGKNPATISYMGQTTTVDINFTENTISKIEILSNPTKTTYYAGDMTDMLNMGGLNIRAYTGESPIGDYNYNDNLVDFNCYIVSESGDELYQLANQLTPGDYNLKIIYKGCSYITKDKPIHILENKVSSIEIAKAPNKTTYYDMADTGYDLSGLELKINYSDKTSEIVPYEKLTNRSYYMEDHKDFRLLSPSDTPYHVVLEYMGKTVTQDIYIKSVPISSVKVVKNPTKTTYIANGECSLNFSGMQIEVTYTDGRDPEIISAGFAGKDGYYIQGDNSSINWDTVGSQTATISYMGVEASFNIEIIENTVSGIKINKLPNQMEYIVNLDKGLNLRGLTFDVTYKNGEVKTLEAYCNNNFSYNYSGNFNLVGTKTITISYLGAKATFDVTVINNPVKSICVSKVPTRTKYIFGADDCISTNGLELTIDYGDRIEVVDPYKTNYNISILNQESYLASVGNKDVTIQYMGYTATYPITVEENPVKSIAVNKRPTKVNYIVGLDGYLNTSGFELNVTDQNGNTKIVSENNQTGNYNIYFDRSKVDLTTIGTKTVYVEYMGCQTSFEIEVVENPVKSIAVSKSPTKTNYIVSCDKYIQKDDLELLVTYKNGSAKTVQADRPSDGYWVSVDDRTVDLTTVGTKTVTVDYMGCQTSFDIEVVENPVTKISVSQLPTKTKYIVNYENYLDLRGLKLEVDSINGIDTIGYNSAGNNSDTTNESSIDWSTTGVKTVIVYYMNHQTSFNIEVVDNPIDSITLDTQNVQKNYYAKADNSISTYNLKFTVHYKPYTGMSDVTYDMDDMDDMEHFNISFNHSTNSIGIPEDIVAGTYPVTISYMGVTADYNVNILANPVASIDILEQPIITSYFDFDVYDDHEYDLSGLVIRINFNNGTAPVTLKYDEYKMKLNGYYICFNWKDTTQKYGDWAPCTGNNAIVIDYMGVTKEIPIKVLSTPVKSMKIISTPTKAYNKLWYSESGDLYGIDLSGLELEITYQDDSTHTFKITKDNHSDARIVDDSYKREIEVRQSGDKIKLSYMEQSIEYTFPLSDPNWGNAQQLSLDTPEVSNIQDMGEGILYQFTPNANGTYKIYSYGGVDTKVCIYDSNKNLISKDDDSGEDDNFRLSQTLLSGNTYYIAVNSYKIGTFHTVISLDTASDINTKSSVKNIAVTDLDTPKLGETPDRGAEIGENQECKISNITWSAINKAEKFKPATKYTVNVTLKPSDGFQFTSATTASINGNRAISKRYNSDGTFTISYTFDYTDCQITLPTSNNYVITGNSSVAYGSNYTFKIVYANGYDSSKSKIKANGILLTPDSSGNCTIPNVKENQTIAVKDSTTAGNGEYSLSFMNNGILHDIINVKAGSKVSSLNAPENVLPVLESTDSQFFMGWYVAQGNRFTSNTVVNTNKELTAKWCNRVITSMYNGYTIYYKILSIDENNRVKVQVGTGTGIAVQQAIPSNSGGFFNPLLAGNGDMIVVPSSFTSTLEGSQVDCDVMSVGNNAFSNSSATSIILPNTVESIGSGAFSGCTSLTSIAVPNSVQTIEPSTFSGCTALAQVALPAGVNTIGDSAFSGCSQLNTMSIPSTVQTVSATAFDNAGTAQGGTAFYCNSEATSVLNNAGIPSDKIVTVTLTLDYEYNDLKLTRKATKALTVKALEGTTDVSGQVTWTTSDANCVSVSNSTGNTTTLTANEATTSDVAVTANYKGVTTVVNVGVTASTKDISTDSSVSISDIANQMYTGSAISPDLTAKCGSDTLILNTDYELNYSNNINAGTATITITGKGNYTGTKTKTFTINPENVSNCNIADLGAQTYAGIAFTPGVNVSKGGTNLALNGDYEVSYTNNTNAGTATVTITGKGNYTGTITKTFAINPENLSNCSIADVGTQTYTGMAITPGVTVSKGGTTLDVNRDYEVSYTSNTNAGTATVTITGKGNYAGTTSKSFTIAARGIEGVTVDSIADVWYTGAQQQPVPTVKDGNNTLSRDRDYTLSYSNNTNAGTASVTINGVGNYSGSKNVTFRIISNLDKVSNLAASNNKAKSIDLTWNNVGCANGYEVYCYNDSKKKYIKIGNSNQNTYTSKKLSAGASYKYKVRAYIKVNGKTIYGNYSDILKTGTCTTKPSISVKLSKKNANINWKKVSGASGYEVYMSTSKNGNYDKIGTLTKSSKVSFTKKNLEKDKTYYFKVVAYSTINKVKIYSDYSSIKSVKVKK